MTFGQVSTLGSKWHSFSNEGEFCHPRDPSSRRLDGVALVYAKPNVSYYVQFQILAHNVR